MAGIYLHIPFCKQACNYCDFHFSTSLKHKEALIKALVQEISAKKQLLQSEIKTIYFGGGTPSLLVADEFNLINESLYKNYNIADDVEYTVECNPDDLTKQKLKELKQIGVNRLSIGTQSFFDEDLKFFNRAHNAKQAEESILLSQDLGFENITIDLIYNSPTLTMQKWEKNLDKVSQLNVPHLSAYTLTVEPKTALYHQVETKKIQLPTDEEAIKQFKLLMEKTKSFGLTQYEVSNFGKEGFYSLHNSNYWKGEEYLGIGPSAHSFLKTEGEQSKRRWNVSNNIAYVNALNKKEPYYEEETIEERTAYNEYILTRLRTVWGIDKGYVLNNFNPAINKHFNTELAHYLKTSYLQTDNNKVTLTPEGIFIADKISSDLFYLE